MVFLFELQLKKTVVSQEQEKELAKFRNSIITCLKENPPNKTNAAETAVEALDYIKTQKIDSTWNICRTSGNSLKRMYLSHFGFTGTDKNYSKVDDFIADLNRITATENAATPAAAKTLSYTHIDGVFSPIYNKLISEADKKVLLGNIPFFNTATEEKIKDSSTYSAEGKDITGADLKQKMMKEGAFFALRWMFENGLID
ncbi:hypothetical protein COV61_04810, partial [Candidatus Micrarchaeota archaeon CG11_big_fil_rev_8_21_14_0_20_47_5]